MDFIGVKRNALSPQICEMGISGFEKANQHGLTISRQRQGFKRSTADDVQLFSCHINADHLGDAFYHPFMDALWEAYREYADKYPVAFENTAQHHVHNIKIQKTEPGQGYHSWHYEAANVNGSRRLLAFTAYLNDVAEGGETEFLYQNKRISAEAGTICIFPTAFTHLHRGNPPLSGVKYIATGWFEF